MFSLFQSKTAPFFLTLRWRYGLRGAFFLLSGANGTFVAGSSAAGAPGVAFGFSIFCFSFFPFLLYCLFPCFFLFSFSSSSSSLISFDCNEGERELVRNESLGSFYGQRETFVSHSSGVQTDISFLRRLSIFFSGNFRCSFFSHFRSELKHAFGQRDSGKIFIFPFRRTDGPIFLSIVLVVFLFDRPSLLFSFRPRRKKKHLAR